MVWEPSLAMEEGLTRWWRPKLGQRFKGIFNSFVFCPTTPQLLMRLAPHPVQQPSSSSIQHSPSQVRKGKGGGRRQFKLSGGLMHGGIIPPLTLKHLLCPPSPSTPSLLSNNSPPQQTSPPPPPSGPSLVSPINITIENVRKVFSHLHPSKAAGPDSLNPPQRVCSFPAHIQPEPEHNDCTWLVENNMPGSCAQKTNNYRPVALTSYV